MEVEQHEVHREYSIETEPFAERRLYFLVFIRWGDSVKFFGCHHASLAFLLKSKLFVEIFETTFSVSKSLRRNCHFKPILSASFAMFF